MVLEEQDYAPFRRYRGCSTSKHAFTDNWGDGQGGRAGVRQADRRPPERERWVRNLSNEMPAASACRSRPGRFFPTSLPSCSTSRIAIIEYKGKQRGTTRKSCTRRRSANCGRRDRTASVFSFGWWKRIGHAGGGFGCDDLTCDSRFPLTGRSCASSEWHYAGLTPKLSRLFLAS